MGLGFEPPPTRSKGTPATAAAWLGLGLRLRLGLGLGPALRLGSGHAGPCGSVVTSVVVVW